MGLLWNCMLATARLAAVITGHSTCTRPGFVLFSPSLASVLPETKPVDHWTEPRIELGRPDLWPASCHGKRPELWARAIGKV